MFWNFEQFIGMQSRAIYRYTNSTICFVFTSVLSIKRVRLIVTWSSTCEAWSPFQSASHEVHILINEEDIKYGG